jgi:23S rRNA (guanosine2251-2'-O)-methyltransferase
MAAADLIYGFHSAEEALRSHPDRINKIWISSTHHNIRIKQVLDLARAGKIPVTHVDHGALNRIAGNTHHQGIVVELSPYQYFDPDQLLDSVNEQTLFCILDEIQDATNLGTLIRTMEGAGVSGIFLPERRAAAVTSTTHRMSAGALENVKIARAKNLANLIDEMHEKDIRVICADAAARKLWYEADYTGPIAILVGNEQKGVRRLLKDKSDELVRIPMLGKLQSLNVNVAAAILLYEAARQRTEGKI